MRLLVDADFAEESEIAEEELIDEYACGGLTAEDAARMERYFFSTPERRHKLKFALAFRRYRERRGAPRRLLRLYLPLAASLLLLVGLGVVIRSWMSRRGEIGQGLLALQSAYSAQRPVEARISGFAYAPPASERGGGENVDSVQRDRAAALLLSAAAEHPTAASHHALGKYYLAERQFDKASAQFDEALREEPAKAELQSDAGAALLEEGKAQRQRGDDSSLETFAKAVEHFDRALEVNPKLTEALFNRALCLQYMALLGEAREAWQKYLEVDPSSKWADEARKNLREIEGQKLVSETPAEALQEFLAAQRGGDRESAWRLLSRSREIVTERLLHRQLVKAFLASSGAGHEEEARELLKALSFAGDLEATAAHDPYVASIARFYAAASPAERAALSDAHGLVSEGLALCLRARYAEALSRFSKAEETFGGVGDAWEAGFAEYLAAYCLYQTDKLSECMSALAPVVRFCERGGYRWLLAQAFSLTANAEAALSEHSKSIEFGERALKLSEEVSDDYGVQKNLSQLANEYRYVGRYGTALACMGRALAAGGRVAAQRQQWRNCEIAAQTLYGMELYHAAAAFGREALRLGTDGIDDPAVGHASYAHLALIYSKTGNYTEALRLAGESLRIGESLSGDASGLNMIAYSTLQAAHINRLAGRIPDALDGYSRAAEMFEHLNADVDRYDAYKGRLLCHLASGDDAAVADELPRVVDYYEKYRAKIVEEKSRDAFFDAEQDVYDLAIGYEYSRSRDPRQAFQYSETFRARSLLDLINGGGRVTRGGPDVDVVVRPAARALALPDLQARIPEQAQIVQYAVLGDRVLIWLVSRTRFVTAERSVPAGELRDEVLGYVRRVSKRPSRGDEDYRREASALYDLLIGPIEPALDPSKELCIVPDKALNYLPFAALVSPRTGRYLAETYTILYAPSATVFALCSDLASKKLRGGGEEVLSVGNPSFDPRAHPDLPDLPEAGREAETVAGIYPGAKLLTERAAIKGRVVAEMGGADMVHLACHYVVDERSPLLSRFVLAGGGELTGGDVLRRRFLRARLVVLSACHTGVERYQNAEGMIGAARAFIAAGVPLVVASQWAVESDATAALMIDFHRLRAQGLSTAVALRQAQLDMLGGQDGGLHAPYYWAAFAPVGGYSNF